MKSKGKKRLRRFLCVVLALLAGCICVCAGFWGAGELGLRARLRKASALPQENGAFAVQNDGSLLYDGTAYTRRSGLFTVLCLGVDRSRERDEDSLSGRYNGVADTIVLAVIDLSDSHVTLVSLPRDTIVPVQMYSANGLVYGTTEEQIGLQYPYGGADDASRTRHTADAVSALLMGLPIDACITVDMDVIPQITDMLGGIPVTVPEDDSYCTYSGYTPGQWVLLDGTSALQFVRYRDTNIFASCEMRIERQKVFLDALVDRLRLVFRAHPALAGKNCRKIAGEIYTNLNPTECMALALHLRNFQMDHLSFAGIAGEVRQDGAFEGFYPDEKALVQTVLSLGYAPAAGSSL